MLLRFKSNITQSLYNDENSCVGLVFYISNVIKKGVWIKLGIQIFWVNDWWINWCECDWSYCNLCHICRGWTACEQFFGFAWVYKWQKKCWRNFQKLLKFVKESGLDLTKCVAFGSDGYSTMVRSKSGITTKFKEVNLFIILVSFHCS